MAFIHTVSARQADGRVREMYARQQTRYGYVPNYAKVFSHRPEIMTLWAELLRGIRRNLDDRRFELVTVAAALAVRSSYCSLAHGSALQAFYTPEQIRAIIEDSEATPLEPADRAMMRFARKVAREAYAVTADDVECLKRHGLSDHEVFDITAAATARTFFAQLCEGLGAVPDAPYAELEEPMRTALTVGRQIDERGPERVE